MSDHGSSGLGAVILSWLDMSAWLEWWGEWGLSRALGLWIAFGALYFTLGHLIPNLPLFTMNWLLGTAPIWMPVGLLVGFWSAWVWYVQSLYLSGRNPVLLEMKVPREITKSPRAMELALASFWISSGETTFIHRGWKGQVRPIFSLEMASFGGEVHFFIWCWRNYVHTVEETMYGMYPEIELHEVEDYASRFEFDPKKYNAYCTDWRLESPNEKGRTYGAGKFPMADVYPIKTYVDFELDKDPKEEFKVDPLAGVIEFLSAQHPYEQIWIQLIIRRCGKYGILLTNERDDEWKHAVMDEIEEIRKKASIAPSGEHPDAGEKMRTGFPHPTPRQKHQMEALERNMSKPMFEFIGRGIYISTKPLAGPTYTHMRWMWKPMGNAAYLAHLRPRRWHNPFDYPWQDFKDLRYNLMVYRFLDAYRRRSGFQSPWITPANVLTTETLATMWHPPSSSIASPGLQRIPAKKASAPQNLPK